jgi:hypothetical protein
MTPAFQRTVRTAILDTFLNERTPTVESVATQLGATMDEVRDAFEQLAAGRAIVLRPDTREIRMAAPFAAAPTDFVVRMAGRVHHANCIWDALGIPAMLAGAGRPSRADIATHCPDCGDALALTVEHDRLALTDHAVAHFAVPAARWWADIVFT